LPTLWTRSYYVESCGHISEDTVKKYIEEQKKK
jgi:putative transposase